MGTAPATLCTENEMSSSSPTYNAEEAIVNAEAEEVVVNAEEVVDPGNERLAVNAEEVVVNNAEEDLWYGKAERDAVTALVGRMKKIRKTLETLSVTDKNVNGEVKQCEQEIKADFAQKKVELEAFFQSKMNSLQERKEKLLTELYKMAATKRTILSKQSGEIQATLSKTETIHERCSLTLQKPLKMKYIKQVKQHIVSASKQDINVYYNPYPKTSSAIYFVTDQQNIQYIYGGVYDVPDPKLMSLTRSNGSNVVVEWKLDRISTAAIRPDMKMKIKWCNNSATNDDDEKTLWNEKTVPLANNTATITELASGCYSFMVQYLAEGDRWSGESNIKQIILPPAPILLSVTANANHAHIEWSLQRVRKAQNDKIKLQWIKIAEDEKKQWNEQEVLMNNNSNITVGTFANGTYAFMLQYFDATIAEWSDSSNMKRVIIDTAQIEAEMVFDASNMTAHTMRVVNPWTVRGQNANYSAIRLKCAMPTKANNVYNIESIAWQVVMSGNTADQDTMIGVISDKVATVMHPNDGVIGVYAITRKKNWITAGQNRKKSISEYNRCYAVDEKVKIVYVVDSGMLRFYQKGTVLYEMQLPEDEGTTYWHPWISLYSMAESCKIMKDVVVQFK